MTAFLLLKWLSLLVVDIISKGDEWCHGQTVFKNHISYLYDKSSMYTGNLCDNVIAVCRIPNTDLKHLIQISNK